MFSSLSQTILFQNTFSLLYGAQFNVHGQPRDTAETSSHTQEGIFSSLPFLLSLVH